MDKRLLPGAGQGWLRRSSQVLHTNHWFQVKRDKVIRPDNHPDTYDHVVAPGSATVLAVDENHQIPVTQQWIYTHSSRQWRLPSGGVDPTDQNPTETAQRELAEEVGLRANCWELIGCVHGADSFTNHADHVFLATDLVSGEARPGPGEADLEVHWMSVADAVDLVGRGELRHAGSAFAVLSFALRDGLSWRASSTR